MTDPVARTIKVWRVRVLATTWLSYAGYYFCRKNFAVVKTPLRDAFEITNSELAHIFTAFLAAYMVGQFVTALLGRKIATRLLLLLGMAITLGCNAIFGFNYLMGPAGYWPMLLLMVVNGLAQATGWPGNVGVLANWLGRSDRGRIMAVWATCYQLGSSIAKHFASLMLGVAGAAWSFWGAAVVMLGIWVLFLLLQRDTPEEVGLPTLVEEVEVAAPAGGGAGGDAAGWDRTVLWSILSMGACYFVFKFLRYALDSWSPMAIAELFAIHSETAGHISTAFDWIGFLGVLFGGWVSDRIFGGRRYQTILWMTVGMLFAFVFLGFAGMKSVWLFGVGLSLCGFMLMGPDSLLSGVGAIDVGGRRGAVLAAGVINGLGSIGPIFQEEIIGLVLDHYGYQSSFYVMIAVALLGVLGTLYLASRSRRQLSPL